MEERENLYTEERLFRFVQWYRKKGIRRLLCDLDDTLCKTREVFRSTFDEAGDFLAQQSTLKTKDEWRKEVKDLNDELFKKMGVNPERFAELSEILTNRYSLGKDIEERTKAILGKIYTTKLEFMEGAEEALSFTRKAGLPIGIVTHAGESWTMLKFEWLELGRFMSPNDVYTVDIYGNKDAAAWRGALNYFNVSPSQSILMGDSPRSDINPGRQIGIPYCLRFDRGDNWSYHNQEMDTKVISIHKLTDYPEALMSSIG